MPVIDASHAYPARATEASSRLFGNKCCLARRSPLTVFLILLTGVICGVSQSDPHSAGPSATPDEIVRRMVEQNEIRAAHLKYFSSPRHYHVEFHGMSHSMAADMHVQATYIAGSGKTFQVIDQSGSHLLLNHVLKKLLDTERDDSQQHESALTPLNYTFKFETTATEHGQQFYVFTVEPKAKKKLLYRGKIWVDAEDYAVAKVEAEPAQSPSFWIKKTEIHHVYAKNGEFWLPEENRSESRIRMGGTAILTIDYGTYSFGAPRDPNLTEASIPSSR
jgi:hypothetical protein